MFARGASAFFARRGTAGGRKALPYGGNPSVTGASAGDTPKTPFRGGKGNGLPRQCEHWLAMTGGRAGGDPLPSAAGVTRR